MLCEPTVYLIYIEQKTFRWLAPKSSRCGEDEAFGWMGVLVTKDGYGQLRNG